MGTEREQGVMGMSDLEGLLERVKVATAPDRELDVRFGMFESGLAMNEDVLAQIGVPHTGWTPSEDEWPRYTASIDAALALVEKTLPGWCYAIQSVVLGKDTLNHIPWCGLASGYWSGVFDEHEGRGATLPLAILAALLTALIAEQQQAA